MVDNRPNSALGAFLVCAFAAACGGTYAFHGQVMENRWIGLFVAIFCGLAAIVWPIVIVLRDRS